MDRYLDALRYTSQDPRPTGDTALLDEQGELHFMGRRDKQVNVRSQRVELADTEHNLVDSVPGIHRPPSLLV